MAAMVLVASPAAAVDPQSVAKDFEPSVVRVAVIGPDVSVFGTGFVVSRDGHVATNFHIVELHIEAGWKVFVVESGVAAENRRPATLVKAFPGEDLAVLHVEGLNRPPVRLSESEAGRPAKGMTVFAIGFPEAGGRLGAVLGTSFTTGTVSRSFTGSWSADGPQISIIQHSAPTNPGNSGGPIVNACGQVVGVNSQREIAIFLGPGGLPIVTDVIQGVFFASHSSVLVQKLRELDIEYSGTRKKCRIFLGVASTNFHLFGGAATLVIVALIAILSVYRPRPVIQVVVRFRQGCARAVERVVRKVRSRRGSVSSDLTAQEEEGPCAPSEPCAAHEIGWRLTGYVVGGERVVIELTADDLRRSGDGIVLGSDPSCDRTLSDFSISSRHARLLALGGGLAVMDLHSDKGTAVDGRTLQPDSNPAPLSAGSQLKLGNVTLHVERF